jgi:hypothetical protein
LWKGLLLHCIWSVYANLESTEISWKIPKEIWQYIFIGLIDWLIEFSAIFRTRTFKNLKATGLELLSYFQVEAPIHRPSFFFFSIFSLTIKDKTKISLTIKILHLGQGSFTQHIFSDHMTNLFTHIDKCLLKWIWFNTNRRYKWHCCLLLFGVTNNRVSNDAFRTFTFSMQQSVHTKLL